MAITFFRSAQGKVKQDFPFYDHLSHNLLLAHKARIDQLLAHQRIDEALSLLTDALKLDIVGTMVDDKNFRRGFADALQNMGLVFLEHLQLNASVECSRRAISVEPSATYSVNLTNALSILKEKPLLSDFSSSVTTQDLGTHIFIACVPKSASTFLKNVLVGITGYRDLFAVFAAGQNEHDLYLPVLNEFAEQNTVTQQHARASEANIQLMQAFGIRPVVLVRNIFDAVVSLHDFYKTGAYFNSYFRDSFLDLDDHTQVDLLIDNIVPWYLQFVASWSLVEKEKRLEILWLDYDELIQNKEDSIDSILRYYGLGAARAAIQKSVETTEADARRNRFNKGVAGRGVKNLTNEQKERIISLTKYHPRVDFGGIGL